MNRKLYYLVLFAFAFLFNVALYAQKQVGDDEILPRTMTRKEMLNNLQDNLEPLGGTPTYGYPWECRPDLYGFTQPPPQGIYRFPSEWEQSSGVILGWPAYACFFPELKDIVKYGISRTNVWIITPSSVQPTAERCLREHGLTDGQLAMINWLDFPIDTIWLRDYGPQILLSEDGSWALNDMSYYPIYSGPPATCGTRPCSCANPGGRLADDASPTRLAENVFGVERYRPQLQAEGGNLQTDGSGACFRARRDMLRRNQFSRWSYTEDQLNSVIQQYLGCEVTVMESLQPYRGDTNIDHIDMFMYVVSPDTILMGSYDPTDDPANAAILDTNAARLESLGYYVIRVPQPQHYCIQCQVVGSPPRIQCPFPGGQGNARECGNPALDRRYPIWATYLNITRVGNAVLVPVYREVPESLRELIMDQEAEALSLIQYAHDLAFGKGMTEVIPVAADQIIPGYGAVHCVTQNY